MKIWAVHFQSESCDDYYECFQCEHEPTDEMLLNWWSSTGRGEEVEYMHVRAVFEVSSGFHIL